MAMASAIMSLLELSLRKHNISYQIVADDECMSKRLELFVKTYILLICSKKKILSLLQTFIICLPKRLYLRLQETVNSKKLRSHVL